LQEHELVKNIQAGDIHAFKVLFEKYHSNVLNLCMKLVGNRDEAEDLCQDIFIKIYQSIDNFELKAKLSTWMYRIAVNVCLNHQRRKKRVQFLRLDHRDVEQGADVFDMVVNPPDEQPDVSLEQKEKEKIIWDAIHSLPESQRVVLILQRYEELSCEQMAQVLQASVSSVQSRLFRAKENLAKKLLPYLDKM